MATAYAPIPMVTPDASGNAYPLLYAGTAARYLVPAYAIDVDGYWYGHMRVPADYASAPAVILSLAANVTTGVTTMQVATSPIADGESYNVTYTAETNVDVSAPATAYLRKDQSFTLTSAPAAGDDLIVRVGHIGTATNDTIAQPTLLVSCVFSYTTA